MEYYYEVSNLDQVNTDGQSKGDSIAKKIDVLYDKMEEINKRYDLAHMIDPEDSEGWKLFGDDRYSIIPNRVGKRMMPACELLIKTTSKKPMKFDVDIWRYKKIIFHEMSKWIDAERNRELRKNYKMKSFDNAPSKKIIDRCFALYDAISKGNKKWTYPMIVCKLQEQGFYTDTSQTKAVSLARKDFEKAKELLGVAKQVYKRRKSDPLKPIIKVPGGGEYKTDFEWYEQELDKFDLGLTEVLNMKTGDITVIPDNKAGHIKKRLMNE